MIARRARPVLCLAIAAVLLAGCGAGTGSGNNRSSTAAAEVNGTPVSLALYTRLVKAEQHRAESTGVHIDWSKKPGADQLKSIQRDVLSTLVRETVVEQLAAAKHLSLSQAELEGGITRIEKALGGPAAFDDQLAKDGLSRGDFQVLFRARLLESKLNRADPAFAADLRAALQAAKVQAYVGPCQARHGYSDCIKT